MTTPTKRRHIDARLRPGAGWVIGAVVALIALSGTVPAWAGYAFGYGVTYDYSYEYVPERLSREHRLGAELDDWIERGDATVTLSPVFEDGIRVAAWANGSGDPNEYDFGLASAIYYFDIPERARQIKIRIRYEGRGYAYEMGDDRAIAGRVWVRDPYVPTREDEPISGTTFVLRANRRSETIRVPARKYVNEDGVLEVHVVADGENRIDVAYIDVETFTREPEMRVIRRYFPTYRWQPWYDYTYQYFYSGPFYFPTDYGYYLYWDFPYYDAAFVGIRQRYRSYLWDYYLVRYPTRRVHVYHQYPRVERERVRYVNRWTPQMQRVRTQYERGRGGKVRTAPDEALQLRRAVTTALRAYRESPSPSTHIARGYGKMRRAATQTVQPYRASEGVGRAPMKTRRSATPNYRTYGTQRAPETLYRGSRTSPSWGKELTKRRRAPSGRATYEAPSRRSADTDRARVSTQSAPKKKARRSAESNTVRSRSSSSGSKSNRSSSKKTNDDDDDKKKRRRR